MAVSRTVVAGLACALALVVAAGGGGCAGRPKDVPQAAAFKKAGKYKIGYTAEQAGTVYVVDEWDNSTKYKGPVREGDRVEVDPDADTISVNNSPVYTQKVFKSGHVIYLQPGAPAPSAP
jgi:hypothetical protein